MAVVDMIKEQAARDSGVSAIELRAQISRKLKQVLWGTEAYRHLSPAQQETLDLACSGLARIVSGDAHMVDSWLTMQDLANQAASLPAHTKPAQPPKAAPRRPAQGEWDVGQG